MRPLSNLPRPVGGRPAAPDRAARRPGALAAALATALVAAQFLLAPVTLGLALGFVLAGRLTRWHPAWLSLPAAAGVAWTAAAGFRPSLTGYLAVAFHLAAAFGRGDPMAGAPAGLRGALAGWPARLAAQCPVAVTAAAAEAAVACRIGPLAGHAGPGSHRSGLLAAARRWYVTAAIARGEVATAAGACVGVIRRTGRRAEITWREAAGGVLCAGHDPDAVSATALELVTAAISHRKAVVIIDSAGGSPAPDGGHGPGGGHGHDAWRWPAGRLRAAVGSACEAAGLDPPWPGGPGGWCEALRVGLAGAGPAWPDAASPRDRAARPPGGAGHRPARAARLQEALVRREVLMACGGTAGRGARQAIARAAVADLTAALAAMADWLGPDGPPGTGAGPQARVPVADCLIWVAGCEAVEGECLAELLRVAARAGASVLLSTADGPTAAWLADQVNVTVLRGPAPAGLGRPRAGGDPQASPSPQAARLRIAVRAPRRVLSGCEAVR